MPPKDRAQAGAAGGPESTPPLAGPPQAPPDPPEIRAAVRRVQQGDEEAFATIQRHYGRGLKQFFLNRGLPDDLAQDLYQDALLRAWRQIGQYRHDGPFGAWLQRIGENVWKNDRRARRARKRDMELLPLDAAPEAAHPPIGRPLFGEPAASPETQAAHSEEVRRVMRALGELPPGQRNCLHLRFADEMTYGQVAAVLGVAIGTAQSQIHDGLRRLRLLLRPGDDRGGGGR